MMEIPLERLEELMGALRKIRDLAWDEVQVERSGERMPDLCARKVFTLANDVLAHQ